MLKVRNDGGIRRCGMIPRGKRRRSEGRDFDFLRDAEVEVDIDL